MFNYKILLIEFNLYVYKQVMINNDCFRGKEKIPGTKHVMGKKIGKILSENNSSPSIPDDLNSLIQKYKRVTKHINMNKKDMSNTRGKNLIMAKMLRLVKYYKREGYLAKEWELNKVL